MSKVPMVYSKDSVSGIPFSVNPTFMDIDVSSDSDASYDESPNLGAKKYSSVKKRGIAAKVSSLLNTFIIRKNQILWFCGFTESLLR